MRRLNTLPSKLKNRSLEARIEKERKRLLAESVENSQDRVAKMRESILEMQEKRKDTLRGVSSNIGMLSNVGNAALLSQDQPNIGASSLLGGVGGLTSALGAGLSLPLALGAGAANAVGSFAASAQKGEDYLRNQKENTLNTIYNSTVPPRSFEEGGVVEEVGIQAEVPELLLLPNGKLVSSKASKKHKDMGKDVITDVVPEGTFVFSANEKQTIEAKKLSKKLNLLGHTSTYYDEFGSFPSDVEEVLVSDIIGDKKQTFSEGAKKIKNYFKTEDPKYKDIFTEVTNKENSLARIPYLKRLIDIQESRKREEVIDEIPQFAGGGFLKDMLSRLDEYDLENKKDFNTGKEEFGALLGRQNFRNLTSLGRNLLFTGAQSNTVEPNRLSTSLVNEQFPILTRSQLSAINNSIKLPSITGINALSSSGATPQQVANLAALQNINAVGAIGNVGLQAAVQNNTQYGKRAAELSRIRDLNSTSQTAANNQERLNRNSRLVDVAAQFQNTTNAADRIDVGKFVGNRELLSDFNANRFSILQNRLSTQGVQKKFEVLEDDLTSRNKQFKESVDFRNSLTKSRKEEEILKGVKSASIEGISKVVELITPNMLKGVPSGMVTTPIVNLELTPPKDRIKALQEFMENTLGLPTDRGGIEDSSVDGIIGKITKGSLGKIKSNPNFIKKLQEFLKSQGLDIKPDGHWGQKTTAAYHIYTGKKQ